MRTLTNSYTRTFTKPRINVVSDQFELFFRCSGMNDSEVEKFLQAIEKHELEAVGAYIVENGYRVAEVELELDWDKHEELIHLHGNLFDTDLPGWRDGVAPEAYIAVSHLSKAAKEQGLQLRTWIRVSYMIRSVPENHKRVCNTLGYSFGSTVEPWESPPTENARQIHYLQEGKVIQRTAR